MPGRIISSAARLPVMTLPNAIHHTGSGRWRNVLVAAMAKQRFVNYSKEWWYFSLPGAGGPAYDFSDIAADEIEQSARVE